MNLARYLFIPVTLSALITGALMCQSALSEAADAPPATTQSLLIRGEVIHLAIEGGFWGIVGEDGRHYDPVTLPKEFKETGLKILMEAKPVTGGISFRQWGTPIQIIHIEKLKSPKSEQ